MKNIFKRAVLFLLMMSFVLPFSSCAQATVLSCFIFEKMELGDDLNGNKKPSLGWGTAETAPEFDAVDLEEFLSYINIVDVTPENIGEFFEMDAQIEHDDEHIEMKVVRQTYTLKEGYGVAQDISGNLIARLGCRYDDFYVEEPDEEWTEVQIEEMSVRVSSAQNFYVYSYVSERPTTSSVVCISELLSLNFEDVQGKLFTVGIPETLWVAEGDVETICLKIPTGEEENPYTYAWIYRKDTLQEQLEEITYVLKQAGVWEE